MKLRKIAACFAAVIMAACSIAPAAVKAEELTVDVIGGYAKVVEGSPGETLHLKVPVRAKTGFVSNPTSIVNPPAGSPYSAGKVTLRKDHEGEVTYITSYDTTYLEFDLAIKETVKIGYYDVPITIEFEDTLQYEGGTKTVTIQLKLHVAKEKEPAQLTIGKVSYSAEDVFIGNTFDITFTIKNEGDIAALNTYFSLDFGASGMSPAYTVDSHKIGDIKGGGEASITLPVMVLPTAEEGFKTLAGAFTYKDIEGTEGKDNRSFYVTVLKSSTSASENAKLSITSGAYEDSGIAPGTSYALPAKIHNVGAQTASNVKVSITEGIGASTGILPGFSGSEIEVPNLSAGGSADVEIPLILSSGTAPGLHELTLLVSYTDTDGISRSAAVKAYVLVNKREEDNGAVKISGIDFTNVSQKPANPLVGEQMTVSFRITNTGDKDVANIRLWGEGLSSANFEPLNSEPYQRGGDLLIGQSRDISMTFRVGKMISEGLNTLKIGYSFDDGGAEQKTGSVAFHILGVINDSNSKPKLILADFRIEKISAEGEAEKSGMLKAGDSFTFYFDIKNTHISKAAKNIKITLVSANDVFSAVNGSASFYTDKIDSNEIYQGQAVLKAKSDLATGSYELNIGVEYEYDNMSEVDIEKGGVTDSNPIKLSVSENARPVIQSPRVENWYDGVRVNAVSTLAFSFYNMGRSALSNVYFTLEGDFTLSNEMEYLGTVAAGGNSFNEFEVIPINSGMCGGTIYVHFEDSNGTEVVEQFPFSGIYVEPEMENNGGDYFPGGDSIPTDVLPAGEAKKDILPLWLFLVIQGGMLLVITPVARKIVIGLHKRKLRKLEEA